MRFTKMHGAGNDYVYVDCFAHPAPENPAELARRISDRHFGVGADGLILICPSEQADAEMQMYNADGSGSEMCGNGIRCVAKYVYEHRICRRDTLRIESVGNVYQLKLRIENDKVRRVRVDMGEPVLTPSRIPTTLAQGEQQAIDVPLTIDGHELKVSCVSMGNPHCVVFVEDLNDDLVLGLGPKIENDPHFPERVNVEFAHIHKPREVWQRTWERGSGETLACGTGACAVGVAAMTSGYMKREIIVHLTGGDLEIEWDYDSNHVFMTGPAVEVFTGEWHD